MLKIANKKRYSLKVHTITPPNKNPANYRVIPPEFFGIQNIFYSSFLFLLSRNFIKNLSQ